MAQELPNLELLIKLLKMTTSTNDGEALTAIRKANDAIKKFDWDWEKLLRGKVKVIEDPFNKMQPPEPEDVRFGDRAPPRPAPPPRYTPSQPQWTSRPPPPPPPRQAPPPPQPAPQQTSKFTKFNKRRGRANVSIDDLI